MSPPLSPCLPVGHICLIPYLTCFQSWIPTTFYSTISPNILLVPQAQIPKTELTPSILNVTPLPSFPVPRSQYVWCLPLLPHLRVMTAPVPPSLWPFWSPGCAPDPEIPRPSTCMLLYLQSMLYPLQSCVSETWVGLWHFLLQNY